MIVATILISCHIFGSPKGYPGPPNILIADEDAPWLVPILSPVAAKLNKYQLLPLLISSPKQVSEETTRLLRKHPNPRCTFFQLEDTESFDLPTKLKVRIFAIRNDPLYSSITIAQKYWKKAHKLVVVNLHDTESVIQAAAWASHSKFPIILVSGSHQTISPLWLSALEKLKVQKLHVVQGAKYSLPSWLLNQAKRKQITIEKSSSRKIQSAIIKKLKKKKIRNIIATRTYRYQQHLSETVWIAPYLSFLRKSVIVSSHFPSGFTLEKNVYRVIDQHGLAPKTITILASYNDITCITLTNSRFLGEYAVEAEPFTLPRKGQALSYGVGRLPSNSLRETSALIAQIILREYLQPAKKSEALMVANPLGDHDSLDLAETVARATAEEFRNVALPINAFYQERANQDKIINLAEKSHFIMFQGHIVDQTIFSNPVQNAIEVEQDYQERIWFASDENELEKIRERARNEEFYYPEIETEYIAKLELKEKPILEDLPLLEESFTEETTKETKLDNWQDVEIHEENHYPNDVDIIPKTAQNLEYFPFVVLQSCSSLDEYLAQHIFNAGGTGFIGSTTSIHSASGSSFLKAFCDQVLYGNATVGEAMRDARNYFFCWSKLKKARGHKEMPKVRRVALSFRLWGDPEMRIFPIENRVRRFAPIKAKIVGQEIHISTANSRLPKVQTPKYFARLYANSYLAGVVRKLKNRSEKRILPLYFFRIAIPKKGIDKFRQMIPQVIEDKKVRVVFMLDRKEKYIYGVYFPKKRPIKNNKTVIKINLVK